MLKCGLLGRDTCVKNLKRNSITFRTLLFMAKLAQNLKSELLSRAHLVLVPAIREGWG